MNLKDEKDILEALQKKLSKKYKDVDIEKFLDLIYRVSILVCIEKDSEEKKNLQERKKTDEEKLEKLKEKEKLVVDLTETKKQKAKEIRKIDKIINNNALLVKE